jgi:hypothetical protein
LLGCRQLAQNNSAITIWKWIKKGGNNSKTLLAYYSGLNSRDNVASKNALKAKQGNQKFVIVAWQFSG